MCGRFSLRIDDIPQEMFDTPSSLTPYPNPDIRPTDLHPVVINTPGGHQWLELGWGLRREWNNRPLINARAESVAEKPTFRHALHDRRCLIPLVGWYEWRDRQRYFFRLPGQRLFAMAGIWYGGEDMSFISLTTEANDQAAEIHARMPALIAPEDYRIWLRADAGFAVSLLQPYGETLEIFPTDGPYTGD